MTAAAPSVRSYEVTLPQVRPDFLRVVNAQSAGAARSEVLRDLRELGNERVGYPDIHVRSLGAPRTSERLARVAQYRGRPELGHAGVRVCVDSRRGTIVDADDSSNFIVAIDGGELGHFHPGDVALLVPEVARG